MTRRHFLPIAALIALASCNGKKADNTTDSSASSAAEAQEPTKELIEKEIFVGSQFSYITNLSSIKIVYTQGDYHISAIADSITLSHLQLQFDSNLLTVNLGHDNNRDYNIYGTTTDITLNVSSPRLDCVSTCGNGSFTSKGFLEADTIQLGVLGPGSINIDSIRCADIDIQSLNKGNISIKHLSANNANILSRSSATITADVSVKSLNIANYNKQTIRISGHAEKLYIKNPKDPNLDVSKMK